jgi:hypothetical protein
VPRVAAGKQQLAQSISGQLFPMNKRPVCDARHIEHATISMLLLRDAIDPKSGPHPPCFTLSRCGFRCLEALNDIVDISEVTPFLELVE